MLERALPIYEREHGSDGARNAHGSRRLCQAAPLERARAIEERAYGRDHPEVAITLMNLGNAYYQLGDYAKARDLQERSLAIKERATAASGSGPDMMNLGNRTANGDHAKKRDMLERALAIDERAYGRDHPEVAATLANLG